MKLVPNEAPGRVTRKARAFDLEIARLRAEGYTLAAIRRSLAAAGIEVSISTVRREVNRQPAPASVPIPFPIPFPIPAAPQAGVAPRLSPASAASPSAASVRPPSPDSSLLSAGPLTPLSSRNLAESFVRDKLIQSITPAKENP